MAQYADEVYLLRHVYVYGADADFDAFYFRQTSMHVESVLFQNLNIYAVKGIFATMDNKLIAAIIGAVAIILLLFRVSKPGRRKPNFAWSLLCVAMFSIGLNLTDRVLGALGMYGVDNLIGMYVEIENEKTRMTYRNMIRLSCWFWNPCIAIILTTTTKIFPKRLRLF